MKRPKKRLPDPLMEEVEALLQMKLPPPQITWTSRVPARAGPPREPGDRWTIAAASWLMGCGDYGRVWRGKEMEFALFGQAIDMAPAEVTVPRILWLGNEVYRVEAKVVARREDVCVLDFGLLAYVIDAPEWAVAGAGMAGEMSLELDPGTYLGGAYKYLDLPGMIYPWRVERIVVEHATRVPASEEARKRWGSPGLMTNDAALRTLTDIERIDTEADRRPGQMERYYLECALRSRIPREPNEHDLPGFDDADFDA